MTGHLFLFQIGPVQAFIVQARRTQDLYIGSRMLSTLAAAGVRAGARLPGYQPVFPIPGASGELPESVPHRFAFISSIAPDDGARAVREAVEGEWRQRFVEPVRRWLRQHIGGGAWEAEYAAQTDSWLEFNWVAVPYAGAHSAVYGKASRALAARRLSREFRQPEGSGPTCTLTGAQPALDIKWEQLHTALNDRDYILLRKNEHLSALGLIKRFAGKDGANCGLDDGRFPSTDEIAGVDEKDNERGKQVTGYLAVLHMDGDRMGKRLSELHDLKAHQEFSRRLAKFADGHVPEIVEQHERARLVYAGGDDVLVLAPLSSALQLAAELRRAFEEATGMTASAGIAITPYDLPLDIALETAREAEAQAKDELGRDAVVVTEAHGSGQTRTAGATWVSNGVDIANWVQEMQQAFRKDRNRDSQVGRGLAYDVAALAHDLAPAGESAHGLNREAWRSLRQAELRRLVSRRVSESVNGESREQLIGRLVTDIVALGDVQRDDAEGWQSVTNWLILARFLAQAEDGETRG